MKKRIFKGKTGYRIKEAGRYFAVYFAVILLILIWNLTHCTSTAWETRDAVTAAQSEAGGQDYGQSETVQSESVQSEAGQSEAGRSAETGNGTIELLDSRPLTVRTVSGEENTVGNKAVLRGAALLGYENRSALRFTDESIRAEVVRAGTGEVLGTADFLLRNQTPYPADETMMYFAFSAPVPGTAAEELELRFSSEGLTRNGVFFTGLTEQEKAVQAKLFYEKKSWLPFNALLYFLAEAALAVFCLKLYRKKGFPFCEDGESFSETPQECPESPVSAENAAENREESLRDQDRNGMNPDKKNPENANRENASREGTIPGEPSRIKIRELFPLLAILAVFLFCMAFSYTHGVRKTANSVSAEMLTSRLMQQFTTIPDLEEEEETIRIRPGQRVRQIILPGQDQLSGLGIRIPDEEESGEAVLEWSLYDETGTTLLGSGSGSVGSLKKISSLLPREDMSQVFRAEADRYLELPLDAPAAETAGRRFLFELSVPAGSEDSVRVCARKMTNGLVERIFGQEVQEQDGTGQGAETEAGENAGFAQAEGETGESAETLPLEICSMAVYRNNGFMKGLFVRLLIILCLLLILLFFAAKKLRGRTEVLYLVCAISMGMVFSFMTPPYTISDERTHVDTVYMVSNTLLGITDTPGPEKMYKRACDIDMTMNYTMPVTTARYRAVETGLFGSAASSFYDQTDQTDQTDHTGAGSDSREGGRDPLELTACFAETSLANVSILCYLPSAIGFTLARLLGRNMITMFMAARWMNVLVFSLIICFAVKRMPYGGACLAVIALFPKTLQQIASCSYDGMVIAGTFLFIAYCLAAVCDRQFSIKDLLVLFLSGFFVASSKGGTYVPVLGIALLIPFAAKRRNREDKEMQLIWKGITAALLGSCAVLFFGKFVGLVFGMLTRQSGTATLGAGASERTLYSMSDLIRTPGRLIDLFLNTVNVRGDGLISEMVGKNLCQRWYFVYAFLFLAFLGMLRERKDKDGDRPVPPCPVRAAGRIWLLFLAASSTALVFLSMLVAFTTKGAAYIEGIQGRYLLPVIPLVYLAAENRRLSRDGIGDGHILYAAACLLALTFSQILLYYFGGI